MSIPQTLIATAAASLNARPSDIPGLWVVPGHPELAAGQLIDLFGRAVQNMPMIGSFKAQ